MTMHPTLRCALAATLLTLGAAGAHAVPVDILAYKLTDSASGGNPRYVSR